MQNSDQTTLDSQRLAFHELTSIFFNELSISEMVDNQKQLLDGYMESRMHGDNAVCNETLNSLISDSNKQLTFLCKASELQHSIQLLSNL